MAEEIRIWQLGENEKLTEINRSKLDFESRIENWLHRDISILSPDLLVIGKQVRTTFGGIIDLLCINQDGDLVIVELKRDKTPRDVTAQSLDYASWIKDLSHEQVLNYSETYFAKSKETFKEAFQSKFNDELPEIINESHSMIIVASEIDDSTERIIKYLSDDYGVDINVAQFQYYKTDDNKELLARIFLIEQSELDYKVQKRSSRKRAKFPSREELEKLADEKGVGKLCRKLANGIEDKFKVQTRRTMISFKGTIDDSVKAIFNIVPKDSNSKDGLNFQIYVTRFSSYTKLDKAKILELLPKNILDWKYYEEADEDFSGYKGFFSNETEVDKFLNGLQNVVRH